jgi:cyclophilin family peptidyl-prolyl cis-trans isomerase
LSSIHDLAQLSAEASEAAAAQGAFWEMHDALFEFAQEWSTMSEEQAIEAFAGYAEDLGLDADRVRRELKDGTYRDKVLANYDEATAIGLGGTPSFVVNGRVVPQGVAPEAFIQMTVAEPPQSYDGPPPQVIDPTKSYVATIRTSKGDVVVELLPDMAPTNVNSFAFLAQDGWYDGQTFFFVQPDSVAYSGDPTNLGMVLPFSGFVCEDEIGASATFDDAGVLAMFAPSPGRNSGMFFITMAPLPDINLQYTVIGRVVDGMEVVSSLMPAQPGDGGTPDSIDTIAIEER